MKLAVRATQRPSRVPLTRVISPRPLTLAPPVVATRLWHATSICAYRAPDTAASPYRADRRPHRLRHGTRGAARRGERPGPVRHVYGRPRGGDRGQSRGP